MQGEDSLCLQVVGEQVHQRGQEAVSASCVTEKTFEKGKAHVNALVILDAEVKRRLGGLPNLPRGAPDIVQGLPVGVGALHLDSLDRSPIGCILHAAQTCHAGTQESLQPGWVSQMVLWDP